MSVKIEQVNPHCQLYKHGVRPGHWLLAINSFAINDVLDYRFYMTDTCLKIDLADEQGKKYTVCIKKREYDDLGLDFETYLMDKQRYCSNKCIFCFVDQMPKGMRDTLYFKDDDSRLSFLFGNYITLTNLADEDIARIIKMKISPINISVHTMDPELRVYMMANPKAGESLKYIRRLTDAGIKVNAQIVLCPGINDGEHLRYSLQELAKLYPGLQSVAMVPVGLTKYREGLFPIQPYTREQAREVIAITHEFSDTMFDRFGERVFYPSDEFFLIAEYEIPKSEYYGEYSQLENGVGLLASLKQEFSDALMLSDPSNRYYEVSLATGVLAYNWIKNLAEQVKEVFPNVRVHIHRVVNDFFGHTITVAGLITGEDLIKQLYGKQLGAVLILPRVMLRHEQDKFLDDCTVQEVEQALGVKIRLTDNDGFDLLSAMVGDDHLFE